MFVSECDGVVFVEGSLAGARALGSVRVEIDGHFTNAQLKSLADVKRIMAKKVKSLGGNCLIEFTYGQKSRGFWGSLFSLDDVHWYGGGTAATAPDAVLRDLATAR